MQIADCRRVLARMAFLRALGKHSGAIRDLHDQRGVPEATDHYAMMTEMSWRLAAGPRRVQTVENWARRWELSASWLLAWGTYALYRWEIGATCRDPECRYRCRGTSWDDPHKALETAVSDGRLYLLPGDPASGLRYLGLDLLGDVHGVYPNPLLQTKAEFLDRAKQAWDVAVNALAQHGISASWPRKLDLHCKWLVRFHVLKETAATILKDDLNTDLSTLNHAVHRLARLIDLPIGM
jgi:hypothetical protein